MAAPLRVLARHRGMVRKWWKSYRTDKGSLKFPTSSLLPRGKNPRSPPTATIAFRPQGQGGRLVIAELAVWIAVWVLRCDPAFLLLAIFFFYLYQEIIARPSEKCSPKWRAVWRVLSRTSRTNWAALIAAFSVLVIALVAGPWSGVVLISATLRGLWVWRSHRNKCSTPFSSPLPPAAAVS